MAIPDEAVRRVFRLIRGGTALVTGPKVLTSREREVLKHFARGMSYGAIAEALGVSKVTVRNVIYRVQDNLNVESKQEVAVWAVRNGMLDDTIGGVTSQMPPRDGVGP